MNSRWGRFFGSAAYAVVIIAGLAGTRSAHAADDVTIGFAAASTGWPWYVSFIKSFNEGAAKHSWKTVVLSANGDVPSQLNQIYDLVAKKVNYLVVGPIDGSAVIPGIKAAHDAGIPVIIIGNPVAKEGDEYVTATRVPDDGQMGRGSAELVVEAIGDGKSVVIVDGLAGQPAVILRHATIDPYFAEHKIKVLGDQPADWDSNKAATVTEDFLTRFPDVDAIFSMDGSETPGVLRAAADAGYHGRVVGLGGTATELAALKAGKLFGTTCMSAGKNGAEAIAAIEAIASGTKYEKTQAVLSPKVTKENADSCPGDW
jgi:ribose transport system substrate-binding protein